MSDLIQIEEELKKSYLEYSLSVIIGRAIPDVRDGLKPVHRRILYAMHDLSNTYNRPYKKSARVVGDVIGKYHPHGDQSVYDALVRMAQDFSMRDAIVDGQGNFGSIDGDAAAAMRYTEVRMSRLAGEFLADIEKETVDFRPNYDNSLEEPAVLPTKVPNLLLNGSSGIAVGMATNIPPHNLGELCDGLLHLLDTPSCPVTDIIGLVKGPDFPTGAAIYGGKGLTEAYTTGRGTIKIRGRAEVEERKKDYVSVVIREIPYALNKSSLVEKIAALINDGRIEGVSDLRDESDRKGIRIVLDLKKGVIPDIVINALYKYTPLETSFGINMLVVADNRPALLNIKQVLEHFLTHRRDVILRRTRFDLRKSEERAHILEGLRIALDNIDEVVSIIRASKNAVEARERLMERFGLSERQAQAILDMRLQRLTNLERQKLIDEYNELIKLIEYLRSILENDEVLRGVIRDEIKEIQDRYATPRKTEILEDLEGINILDLIPDEDVVITLSRRGYIKRTKIDNYQQQKRGGKGIAGVATAGDDFVQSFCATTNHQQLLLFTNLGRMFMLPVHQIPEGQRTAKGAHIANLLPMDKEEFVATALSIREFSEERYFLFVTRKGMVKRTCTDLYKNCRSTGIIAVGLKENDELLTVKEIDDETEVLLATQQGLSNRFHISGVRPTGRGAAGVKGIALKGNDRVAAGVVITSVSRSEVLTVSANGYGKRTSIEHYPIRNRGGSGVINMRVTPKTGQVIGAVMVGDDDELLLLTSANKIIRLSVSGISSVGRATQGVMLVRMDENDTVMGFDLVDPSDLDRCAPSGE
ncbi:DNA gyrase subunit A [Solidesulfovibrio magneticus]|uniref:DNA gyrase subunit A n=1 Tax=Solidesulfovibrio magneticus (strain ATCC 700980 / DSM 13731 / RS-1) TaxID=573370 RepID=C4XT13_SOLM1|nr:DNA gyrase subunit A [Solidesulfovibrio magneticus]BAH73495.1 DNA gyrase subunit A [Solidesulfovibrio magneticus RS-1]